MNKNSDRDSTSNNIQSLTGSNSESQQSFSKQLYLSESTNNKPVKNIESSVNIDNKPASIRGKSDFENNKQEMPSSLNENSLADVQNIETSSNLSVNSKKNAIMISSKTYSKKAIKNSVTNQTILPQTDSKVRHYEFLGIAFMALAILFMISVLF